MLIFSEQSANKAFSNMGLAGSRPTSLPPVNPLHCPALPSHCPCESLALPEYVLCQHCPHIAPVNICTAPHCPPEIRLRSRITSCVCRGSHETNTVITCPGKLFCEAAALRLQTILIRRPDLESRIHILVSW